MDTAEKRPGEGAATADDGWRHAFNVADTFRIESRGLVVLADVKLRSLPTWLALKVGDPIEFRRPGSAPCGTTAAGLEMFLGAFDQPFAVLLPATVAKSDVPAGSEAWVSAASVRPG